MHFFTDSSNGRWEITLPIGTVFRVRAASEGRFDLFDPEREADGVKLLAIVTEDRHLLTFWELLFLVIEPQAEQRGINGDQFGLLMAAEHLLDARKAFLEEWRDFFQKLQRADMAAALEKTALYQAKARELVAAKVKDLADGLDPKIEAKLQEAVNSTFGSLRESLDKTLAPTPGDNCTK
jgi:hypothetical protein